MKSIYSIKNIELNLGETIYLRDDMIIGLSIMEEYINRKLPIILLELMLDIDVIRKLVKYKNSASLKLEIYEITISSDTEDIIDTKLYLKDSFSIISKNEISDFRLLDEQSGLPDKNRLDQYMYFSAYLIKNSDMLYFSKEHSFVFKNASKPDMLKAIFKMKDIPSGLVIASPPKNGILTQAIIPQGDLISNINYMNKKYGLYPSTPIIYKDLFNLYCLCRHNPDIILTEGPDEYNIVFVIPDDRSSDIMKNGYVIDKTMKIFEVHTNTQPVIRDMSQTASNTQFGTIMTVDDNGKVEKSTIDSATNKLKYIYKDNELSVDQSINDDYSSTKKIEIDILDTSLRYFKPYKICTLVYSQNLSNMYNVANKRFMISGTATSFVKNGNTFNISTKLILSEIK